MEKDADRQAQEDEMEILSEILDTECFTKFVCVDSAISGQMKVKLHIPGSSFKCKCRNLEEKTPELQSPRDSSPEKTTDEVKRKRKWTDTILVLKHLPPLQLHFTLPSNYPSVSKPVFTLSSTWVSRDKLTILCLKLDELWEENQGMAILYTWYSFLQTETFSLLGAVEGKVYDMTRLKDIQRSKRMLLRRAGAAKKKVAVANAKDVPSTSSVVYRESPSPARDTKRLQIEYDPRAVFENTQGSLSDYLWNYEASETEAEFLRSTHSCAICLSEKRGKDCMLFLCGHIFCKECLRDFFSLHITEGSLDCVKCPDVDCKTVPTPSEVKTVVGDALYERYDTLLLSKVLDSMSDILVCPRTSCGKPVMYDPSEKLANCASCGYSFCSTCKMVYHGVEPCRFVSGVQREIYEKYTSGSEEEKNLMEKMYGRKQMQALVNQIMSEDWVTSRSKKCPHCQAPIEKFEGCNKVTCFKCSTYFCWICLNQLNKQNPYSHFNDPQSRCYNNLFMNVDGEEEEEDDWEILVENDQEDDDSDFDFSDDDEAEQNFMQILLELQNRIRRQF